MSQADRPPHERTVTMSGVSETEVRGITKQFDRLLEDLEDMI
jgi:hypothetical protein